MNSNMWYCLPGSSTIRNNNIRAICFYSFINNTRNFLGGVEQMTYVIHLIDNIIMFFSKKHSMAFIRRMYFQSADEGIIFINFSSWNLSFCNHTKNTTTALLLFLQIF